MKSIRRLYFIPVIISAIIAGLLIWFILPPSYFFKAVIIVLIALIIVALGFQIITFYRIRIFRNQLYQILETLEKFDVDEPKFITFEASPFAAFNELNEYLVELIDRVKSNYQANKQFTQNASHELQTPLAIIKGHVEILLQSPNIGEKEIESLAAVLQNTNRLSKINSALILLSKIENHRFVDTKIVNFITVTDDILQNFKDHIQIQSLQIIKDYKKPFEIEMSAALSEILVANLIQNAIRYNIKNSKIQISVDRDHYIIRNPGKTLNIETSILFKRFKRVSEVDESLGLGLPIVKRICEQSGLSVEYIHENGLHSLVIARV